MTRLHIVVEGQSEEAFVKRTLKPHLAAFDVFITKPILIWTNRNQAGGGYRGGVSQWRQIQNSITPLLNDSDAWVTTLMDFYGLPDSVPGFTSIKNGQLATEAIKLLQTNMSAEFKAPRFLPFLALHELEAWVFSAPNIVAQHFGKLPSLAASLEKITVDAGGPELINHGATTHPKQRLKSLCGGYHETVDSPILLEKIGIAAIRDACPHFAQWLTQLESLSTS